jgi:FkbM family methyltransferase
MHRALTTKECKEEFRSIALPRLKYTVKLRAGTADASTLEKIFVWKQYDLSLPKNTRTILDCGANIGLAAIWFAQVCPEARILAIEPEPQNYRLLEENCAPYSNIRTLRAAVWNRSCDLFLSSIHSRVDSYQFTEAYNPTSDSVKAYDLSTIMTDHGIDTIDVLKVDIEGAEAAVFSDNFLNWLGKTRMLIIEIHGDEARTKFEAAAALMKWQHFKVGENDILVRQS